jgi:hypothetical protein
LLVTAEPSGGIRLDAYFEPWKLGLLYLWKFCQIGSLMSQVADV